MRQLLRMKWLPLVNMTYYFRFYLRHFYPTASSLESPTSYCNT